MNRVPSLLAMCFAFSSASFAQQHLGIMNHDGNTENMPLPRPEKGRPFSAVVKTQTVQTFLDGTRVNQTTTRLVSRDFDGRVRSETLLPNGSSAGIVIRDPVAGVTYRLNPTAKLAVKDQTSPPAGTGHALDHGSAHSGFHSNETAEDLGMSNVNGVTARGTRIRIVVPVGAIGNDREFRNTGEHWFSAELNLIVKSVSTDPRFGTTTYELTNIERQNPDPALFQVPSSYTIVAARDSHNHEAR